MTDQPTPPAVEAPRYPRAFVLVRTHDVSGVSGTGDVAEGVEFRDGTVALRWTSQWPTSVVFHDRGIASVEAIHGHNGATRIAWLDNGHAREAADLRDRIDTLTTELADTRQAAGRSAALVDIASYLIAECSDGNIAPAALEPRWTAAQ